MLFSLLILLHSALSDVLEIRMPGVSILSDDTYYHVVTPLTNPIHITGYEARANSSVVHHLLLYGCKTVRDVLTWIGGKPCVEKEQILWAWALDAPRLDMPDNVSIPAGGSDVNYLVLEMHYKVKQAAEYKDTSGIDVFYSTETTKYQAGIFRFMAEEGSLAPGHKSVHLDVGCNYTAPKMTVFAYRPHAHTFSRQISGYIVHNKTWTMIGSRDPREVELFVMMGKVKVIRPGDEIYARCEYDTRATNKTLHMGNTHHDEMCMFYLMYYTDNGNLGSMPQYCTHALNFTLPPAGYIFLKSGSTLYYILIAVGLVLIAGPMLYGIRCCSNRYKNPNEGFQQLFEEEEEEEVLYYKAYRNNVY